jgi:hypothetical protein
MASTGLLGFNPYGKGVAIDISSKPVNLAIQLKQRDIAKMDALDKYFMDYERSINPAGVRNVDADVFVKKLNNNKAFYLQNRDKILNPTKYGYEAQSQYMSNFKDMVNLIDQSKQAAANEKVVNERIYNAVQQGKSLHDGILPLLDRQRLSIVDPNYSVFDANQLQFDKPYDEKQFNANVLGGLKFPEKQYYIDEEVDKKKTGLKIPVTESYLDDSNKKAIQSSALNEYASNPNTKRHFDDLMKRPDMVKMVNDKFKDVYKQDIKKPEDFVVGYALLQAPVGITKTGKADQYLTWSEKNAITNAQQNARSNKLAASMGGFGSVQAVIENATGKPFVDNDVITKLNFSPSVADEFVEEKVVPANTVEYEKFKVGAPYKTKTVKVPYGIGLDKSTGNIWIAPQKLNKNGDPIDRYDWPKAVSGTEDVTSIIINKFQGSTRKANLLGKSGPKVNKFVNVPKGGL